MLPLCSAHLLPSMPHRGMQPAHRAGGAERQDRAGWASSREIEVQGRAEYRSQHRSHNGLMTDRVPYATAGMQTVTVQSLYRA